ncbi:hypothetical protein ACTS9K_16210 [Empedobacter sp. ULE_I145]
MNNKEFLEIFLEESKEISNKIKRLEELSAQIEQNNLNHLRELKQTDIKIDRSGVNQSIEIFKNVIENANKTLDRTQKGVNWVLFSAGFCLITLVALFLIYKKGIETKTDIKEEYKNELIQKGQYNNANDAEFYRKFWRWVDKNPNDSKDLFKKVDKMNIK